jgi:S-adenosylmethionine:tRNA ribosyltransferase-isomerase
MEIFVLSTHADAQGLYPCLLGGSGKKRVGDVLQIALPDNLSPVTAWVRKIAGDGTFALEFDHASLPALLECAGGVPIPPYIRKGQADERDRQDYQTLFAQQGEVGSVAAPTAGLHFTPSLLDKLAKKKIEIAPVTLHVGTGTFAPVKTSDIREHAMHTEHFSLTESCANSLAKAWSQGRPVFAVGTTSLRVLESIRPAILRGEEVWSGGRSTNIFLHPGKTISSIQGLITNFHLPESSLLMLVSALMGRQRTLDLYAQAVRERYRFFSYGDGMLLWP